MTVSLAEKAARAARPNAEAQPEQDREDFVPDAAPIESPPIVEGEPEDVPVHVAWRRVMRDVPVIGKNQQMKDGPKFKFRGVDDVTKAFNTAIRRHGIIIGPEKVEPTYSNIGPKMHQCTIVVSWWVMGPRGDFLAKPIQSAGEAMDYQDKSTAKAQSIALRTLMTTLGFVSTDDPEPELESEGMERGDPTPKPNDYIGEITNPMTGRERFRQIYNELTHHRLDGTQIEYEGEQITLGKLFLRVAEQRWPQKPARPAPPATPDHNGHLPGVRTEGRPGCDASAAIDREAAER